MGYDDFGLTSGSLGGGASGAAMAGATAVLMLVEYVDNETWSTCNGRSSTSGVSISYRHGPGEAQEAKDGA